MLLSDSTGIRFLLVSSSFNAIEIFGARLRQRGGCWQGWYLVTLSEHCRYQARLFRESDYSSSSQPLVTLEVHLFKPNLTRSHRQSTTPWATGRCIQSSPAIVLTGHILAWQVTTTRPMITTQTVLAISSIATTSTSPRYQQLASAYIQQHKLRGSNKLRPQHLIPASCELPSCHKLSWSHRLQPLSDFLLPFVHFPADLIRHKLQQSERSVACHQSAWAQTSCIPRKRRASWSHDGWKGLKCTVVQDTLGRFDRAGHNIKIEYQPVFSFTIFLLFQDGLNSSYRKSLQAKVPPQIFTRWFAVGRRRREE